MKIAVCADESYPVHAALLRLIELHGHAPVRFGAFTGGGAVPWATTAEVAAEAVAAGACDEGIFLCWTGTGTSIAANKVANVRAALCTDATTAAAARTWNHANVLCLSHRLLTDDLADEILRAWFTTAPGDRGREGVARLADVDRRHRR
ncbi:RpiB/LacA/LacB family sugar-phosphate isomerase [Nannocystis punicea]|uniref:RpiB/LacA/LacB family sugar-phosphate isomerase n=1 Tax=Nannocystis punicea TaxID=2995304 RepID=A0ABY7HHV1_9BACT|nr:RpiB/LacA/LacB family sugar-phosphate isomerase [Nannocystis poenicansa]WAS98887.1 RpiB/LacA/LacB family sugar-phosphate isomerase [Nannocystis poenicansa]